MAEDRSSIHSERGKHRLEKGSKMSGSGASPSQDRNPGITDTRFDRKSSTTETRAAGGPSGRRLRRQEEYNASRLPTPPPDPIPEDNVFEEAFARHRSNLEAETLRKEGEFLDYLMRLPTPNEMHQPTQLSQSASVFAASLEAEDAFDHLDRLYRLMEQVLALREQNSKLARRVRELEHLRALTDAHQAAERAISTSDDSAIPEEDTSMAESLLNAMLSADYDPVQKRVLRPPVPRQRSRSVGIEGTTSILNEIPLYRQISNKRRSSGTQVAPKVSKWTKVKAAFKWERAYTGGMHDSDTTKYLKVPETPAQESSGLSSPMPTPTPPTPGTLSSASSAEDVDLVGRGSTSNSCTAGIPQTKADQRHEIEDDTTDRQIRSFDDDRSSSGYNPSSTHIAKIDEKQSSDLAARRLNPALTVTVPSNEELRGASPESVSPSRSPENLKCSQNSSPVPPARQTPSDAETPQDTPDVNEGFKKQAPSKDETFRYSPQMQRHNSKWFKVKKALLSGSLSVPPSPTGTASFFTNMDGLDSDNASAEDLQNKSAGVNIQAEIQRNYHILHKKLSVEFYTKYAKWEKLKATPQTADCINRGPTTPSSCVTSKARDAVRLQLLGEDRLSPDFRKKLDEWKRIKKGYQVNNTDHHSSRRRFTDWQLWRSPSKPDSKLDAEHEKSHLSEDFIKKMEEWKRIRSRQFDDDQESRGSKYIASSQADHRKSMGTTDFSQCKLYKHSEGTGLQCLEKELSKLEREQQKIERQKEKFLDREARLSRLRRVVGSSPQKKEVLVQTATGSFRFEGISRKFTRKLYEWEKSQGISAESSTFQLLNPRSRFNANIPSTNSSNDRKLRSTLKRSRSVGSMVEESTKNETPARQPSSLSLNDMDEMDAKSESHVSSEPMIADMAEDMAGALDDYEPEAIIVDIEDVIEETASPLSNVQPHQTPIYSVATSETTSIAVPLGTVTASHQPSPVLLVEAGESCPIPARVVDADIKSEVHSPTGLTISHEEDTESFWKTPIMDNKREQSVESRKAEESLDVGGFSDVHEDESEDDERKSRTVRCRADLSKPVEDSTAHGKDLTRNSNSRHQRNDKSDSPTSRQLDTASKNSERVIDDILVRKVKKYGSNSFTDFEEEQSVSWEAPNLLKIAQKTSFEMTDNRDWELPSNGKEKIVMTSSESGTDTVSKLQKKIGIDRSEDAEDCGKSGYSVVNESSIKTPDVSTLTFGNNVSVQRIVINENTLDQIVVRTASNEPRNKDSQQGETQTFPSFDSNVACAGHEDCSSRKEKNGPRNVFVKTTRMIFSPFKKESKSKIAQREKTGSISSENSSQCQFEFRSTETSRGHSSGDVVINDNKAKSGSTASCRQKIDNTENGRDAPKRPPLPQSPVLSRKEYHKIPPKDASSSIKVMIQRYNQKLDESGSPASSGSTSPIWRSPSSDRRIRSRTEKYLMEATKTVSNPLNSKILKSASTGVIRDNENKSPPVCTDVKESFQRSSGVLKSPSENSVDTTSRVEPQAEDNRKYSPKTSEPRTLLNVNESRCGKLSPALIHKLTSLSVAAAMKEGSVGRCNTDYITQPSLRDQSNQEDQRNFDACQNPSTSGSSSSDRESRLRAQKIQEAKENFLSFGPGYSNSSRNSPSNVSYEVNTGNDTPIRLDLIKSASAGMINVDVDTFERLSMDRGCESLPRPSKRSGELTSRLTNMASKFRRARLKRGKDKEGKLSTISVLCRQSLLVDIQSDDTSKSCPSTPAFQREEDECSWSSRT